MSKINNAVTLFYSSTDDKDAENRKKLVESVCRKVEQARDISIHLIYWKDNIPGGIGDKSGQDKIDDFVRGKFDIYFGCLGVNFGKSTIKEFKDALQSHIDNGTPGEVLFAFDEQPVNPFEVPDNFHLVKKFRSNVQGSKKYGKSILYFTFLDSEQLTDKLFRDLNAAVKSFQTKIRGGGIPI